MIAQFLRNIKSPTLATGLSCSEAGGLDSASALAGGFELDGGSTVLPLVSSPSHSTKPSFSAVSAFETLHILPSSVATDSPTRKTAPRVSVATTSLSLDISE